MRQTAYAVLIALSVSLHAASVGSSTVGPAPYGRSSARLASGAAGTIAVWLDGRAGERQWQLFVAFLDGDGAPLRILPLERMSTGVHLQVAADDEGFLIVTDYSMTGLRALRVDRDGVATPSAPVGIPYGNIGSLSSNGTSYALADSDGVSLLDRTGRVMSGRIRFEGLPSADYSIASAGGRWLISTGDRRAAVESRDFPRPGAVREIAPAKGDFETFVSAGDTYVAWSRDGSKLRIRRLDPAGEPISAAQEYTIPRAFDLYFAIAAEGNSLMLQAQHTIVAPYVSTLVCARLSPDGGVQVLETPGANRDGGELISTGDGVIAAWRTAEHIDAPIVRTARIDSTTWNAGGAMLATSRPAQTNPVLIDGGNAILAAWVETSYTGNVYLAAIVSRDGELLTTPVELTRTLLGRGVMGAFGSSRFLVVYQDGISSDVHGQFIGLDGKPIGEPFELLANDSTWALTSVASDGTDFFVASELGIQQVRADGTIVNRDPYRPYKEQAQWGGTFLAWDGERFLSIFRKGRQLNCTCPYYESYITIPLSRAMHLDGTVEVIDEVESPMGYAEPAVAARNGRAVTIWGYASSESTFRRWYASAFDRSGVLHRRELALLPPPIVRPHAVATEGEVLLSAGPTLARLDWGARLLAYSRIDDDVLESNVVAGPDGHALVFYQRLEDVPRLELKTVPLPSGRRRSVRAATIAALPDPHAR